jgi:hypothetical protein
MINSISLPFRATTMTVHLDQPLHNGFLCTSAEYQSTDDQATPGEIGILYKNGTLWTFQPTEYSPPIEPGNDYTPPFAGWWNEHYTFSGETDEMFRLLNRPNRYD